MSRRYVVQARKFAGSLAAPTRNDCDGGESDDHREAERIAEGLAERGWRVWLYEDRHHGVTPAGPFDPPPVPAGGRFRVIAEWKATGERVL